MTYMGQKLFCFTLTVLLVLVVADGRPPYFDGNEIERTQSGITYYPFYPYPGYNRFPDNQYEKLRFLFEGQDSKPASGSGSAVDTLLREPESKRQAVRYRQCYFNPISCFRK